MPHARLSWPSCQLLGERKYTVPYRIVSYARNYFFEENGDFKRLLFRFERVPEELRWYLLTNKDAVATWSARLQT